MESRQVWVAWLCVIGGWIVTLRWALIYRGAIQNTATHPGLLGAFFLLVGVGSLITMIAYSSYDAPFLAVAASSLVIGVWSIASSGGASGPLPPEVVKENAYISFALSVGFTVLTIVVTYARG